MSTPMEQITSAEFLSKIPKKSKEDHDSDKREMKKISSSLKDGVDLNPKMDIEEAAERVRKLIPTFIIK